MVLEFKCRSNVPHWMTDLIRRHDLRRKTFSKYSIGVFVTGAREGSQAQLQRCGGVMQ